MARLSKLRPSPAMVVALIALFVALGSGAYAAIVVTGKNVRNGSLTGVDFKQRSLHGSKLRADSIGGGSIKESTLGPVTALSHAAVVNAGGQLVRGRGVLSTARTAQGRYQVIFDRDVRGCVYVASVGDPTAAGPGTGTASVASLATNINGVDVRTVSYNAGGNPVNENRPFHLLVSC
ncbi:MAG TPA: hypothetical protein VEX36_03765 [Thermoleophilaceae bacterium]|nr:hypothetical protein [Thermoleophilaceae bacterium]